MSEVFDSDSEGQLANKEWHKLMDMRYTDGLRDGISEGQNSVLQEGFDISYNRGFSASLSSGKLRGILTAVLACPDLETSTQKKIQELILSLSEKEVELCSFKQKSRNQSDCDEYGVEQNAGDGKMDSVVKQMEALTAFVKEDCEKLLEKLDWGRENINTLFSS